MKPSSIIFALLLATLTAFSQSSPPLNLNFEPPDAAWSGGTYWEGGKSFPQVTDSNTGSAQWGLSTNEAATGVQSMYLTVQASPSSTVNPTVFSRREQRIGTLVNNQTYWMSYKVWYNTNHENPLQYGRIASQVKISLGYGFQFGVYEMIGSSAANIPIGLRYFERTGPDQGDTILDSGEIYSGVSLARNAWHTIKYQFRNSSTPGDAFVRLWVNDTLALERTNLHVVAYSNTAFEVRLGNYSRYEPRRVEKRYDDVRFGLNESDVTDGAPPIDPETPPADDHEFASEALSPVLTGYAHVRAEVVVNSTDLPGIVSVSDGNPAPLSAADITGPAVHFSTNGYVYAREYGLNKARKFVRWNPGVTNTLDFYLNRDTARYDVWLTPTNASAILLARNFSYTNLIGGFTHLGWSTNLTADLISATNVLRRAIVTTVTAGTPGGD